MERVEETAVLTPKGREDQVEYLFDMIGQLAKLARAAGETQAAIFLEAILLARRCGLKNGA